MEIRSTREGDHARMEVEGELDIATGPRLDEAVGEVLEAGCTDIVVDLGGTTFLDSAGMSALVRAVRSIDQHGGRMRVLSPPGSEARVVLEMARIGDVVGLQDP
ncbi:MAG TPA: STAS domain-containing protein [Thermoleophilaceae bacterium]|jgi:anti-sigma B factor antagonist|nr:STAS domain-containing protein [Thermoleophilaceae bacterium]